VTALREKASVEADILAISKTKGLYCHIIDRIVRDKQPGDEEKLLALFTKDAALHFTMLSGAVVRGYDEIRAMYCQGLPATIGWMWHSVGADVIDVDCDTATGLFTLYAMSTPIDNPTAQPSLTYGRYTDEFRRDNGRAKPGSVSHGHA